MVTPLRPLLVFALVASAALQAQVTPADPFISVRAPVVALTHARVIDGRGHAPLENQTIIVRDGKIAALGTDIAIPAGAEVHDLAGKTVLPGLVMLHEHLYFTSVASPTTPRHFGEMEYSAPRLYFACGVTTARTGGSFEPYTDLEVKARIDSGAAPGPKFHLTAPYLEGPPSIIPQLHPVDNADDAVRLVNFWADKGFTSFKCYMHLPHAVMRAAIDAAHKRGLKITGHIGTVTYREAAELGIDNLEHGFYAATDFVRGKKMDELPMPAIVGASQTELDINSPEVAALIRLLIDKHVALTSTLTVFEGYLPNRPSLSARELESLSTNSRDTYLNVHATLNASPNARALLRWTKMLALEKKFFDAGGLLVAGTDPTGNGSTIPGHGSLRAIELLVEAGLSPVEAIQVASFNGARWLGVEKDVGSVEVGKAADLVVIAGDPSKNISDLRKIEIVFKDGNGYDSKKLIDSVKGCAGIQ